MKMVRSAQFLLVLLVVFSCVLGGEKSHNDLNAYDPSKIDPHHRIGHNESKVIKASEDNEHSKVSHYDSKSHVGHDGDDGHHGVRLASWRFSSYGSMFLCTLMLILCVIVKICFHYIPILSKYLPESCFLILLGIVIASITYINVDACEGYKHFPKFTADLFFNILLPPIILDSSFALYDRDFFTNFRSVVTFAVGGTIFNVFTIGYSLYGLASAGAFGEFHDEGCGKSNITTNHTLGAVESLIFSSLISAVDPVAVLAIFEEIKVNTGLYFLVFGESLFNDGVTVVLYNTMLGIENIDPGVTEIILSIVSFFFVVFGGFLIGVLCGGVVGFITTKTINAREIEPLLVFAFGYLAFILAELVHWSGIISIIGFGLIVKRYALTNISQKSYTTVKYATKTMAVTSDCIIFLFLGMVIFSEKHHINWRFLLATISLCTVYRFIGTFMFSYLTNRKRNIKINFREQFIMAYGGLRGAVGFSLAVVLNDQKWYRELFLTTALAIVFFTCFIQGSTIKFLVKLMGITLRQSEDGVKQICPQIQETLFDNIMGGMEVLIGRSGHYGLYQKIQHFDNKFIRKFLISKQKKEKLERALDKVILEEHYTNLYAPRILAKAELKTPMDISCTGKKPEYTPSKHMKTWQNAISKTSFYKYQNRMDSDVTADDNNLEILLEKRRQRAKTMENKILLGKQLDRTTSIQEDAVTMRSSGKTGDNRKSLIASMMIAEYDRVSCDKRQRLSSIPKSPTSPLSPVPQFSFEERKSRKVSQGNVGFSVISEQDEDTSDQVVNFLGC